MADLNFPNDPIQGQTWTDPNGVVWVWARDSWYQKSEVAPMYLNELLDIDITTVAPVEDDILTWDAVQSKFVTTTPVINVPMVHYGTSAPTDISSTPIWFNTTTGFTSIYYDDGNSEQWVAIGGSDARVSTTGQPYSALAKTTTYIISDPLVWAKIKFTISGTGSFDTNNDFNNGTYTYTVPVDGIYTFSTNVRLDNLSHNTGYTYLVLRKNNGAHIYSMEGNNESTNYQNMGFSVQLNCSAGDEFNMWIYENNDSSFTVSSQSFFSMTIEHEL